MVREIMYVPVRLPLSPFPFGSGFALGAGVKRNTLTWTFSGTSQADRKSPGRRIFRIGPGGDVQVPP